MSGKKITGIILAILGLIGAYYYIGGYFRCQSEFNNVFGSCDAILDNYFPMMAASVAAIILGGFLIFKGNEEENNNSNTNPIQNKSSSVSTLTFNGDKSLTNDAYKIYLVKKYGIEKNEALGKFIVSDKLFNSIEEALSYTSGVEEVLISYDAENIDTQNINHQNKRIFDSEDALKYNINLNNNNGKFTYKGYSYDNFQDAINFAKSDLEKNSQTVKSDTFSSPLLSDDENNQEPINITKKDLAENTHDNEGMVKASLSSSNSEADLPKTNPFFLAAFILIAIGLIWYFVPFIDYASLEGKPAKILFETKVVKSRIENTVGKENVRNTSDFFNVTGKVPIGPLKRDGIYLVGSGCMKPNCANKGLIFVNTQNDEVFIVLTEQDPYRFTAYGMSYNEKNKSFNKPMPPSALRWLRSNNIRIQ